MAHFAKVDENNLVTQVIVIEQDMIDTGNWGNPSSWIQTYYNTRAGVHNAPNSHTPDGGVALRKNYAGIGYTYDETRDAFIPPKPYSSWVLVADTCQWEAPIAYPDDGKKYMWDEDVTNWVEVTE